MPHGRDNDANLLSGLRSGYDTLSDEFDPLRVTNRGTTVFLNDKSHKDKITGDSLEAVLPKHQLGVDQPLQWCS